MTIADIEVDCVSVDLGFFSASWHATDVFNLQFFRSLFYLSTTLLSNPAMLNARFESAEATFVAGTI